MKVIWSDNAKPGKHKEFVYTESTRNRYGDKITDLLLEKMQAKMEALVGKNLLPTYSFFRFYPKGSGLKPHRDRPSCEYSASLCLYSDYTNLSKLEPDYQWPMFCDGTPLNTRPGDAIIYMGQKIKHWREPLRGKAQLQVFLHYINADGPYADKYKYDGRYALSGLEKSNCLTNNID
jgi:hypothetical protein